MFEALRAWREVGHLAEYLGLSVGMLAGMVALFLYVPLVRKLAIVGAIAAVALGIGLVRGEIVGHRDGKAEVQGQWDDARKAAIAADEERDRLIEQQLEAQYQPRLGELQAQAAAEKARADGYEAKGAVAKGHSAAAAACELGDAADRVPVPRPAPRLRSRR
jgi:hypothetical protein